MRCPVCSASWGELGLKCDEINTTFVADSTIHEARSCSRGFQYVHQSGSGRCVNTNEYWSVLNLFTTHTLWSLGLLPQLEATCHSTRLTSRPCGAVGSAREPAPTPPHPRVPHLLEMWHTTEFWRSPDA